MQMLAIRKTQQWADEASEWLTNCTTRYEEKNSSGLFRR